MPPPVPAPERARIGRRPRRDDLHHLLDGFRRGDDAFDLPGRVDFSHISAEFISKGRFGEHIKHLGSFAMSFKIFSFGCGRFPGKILRQDLLFGTDLR